MSEGPFEIRTPHWQASFQRRVHDPAESDHSPNRGVLPYVVIGKDIRSGVILVPLADGEALWIALMCGPRDIVRAKTADGHPIVASQTTGFPDDTVLLALEAVHRDGADHPIDRDSVRILRSWHGEPTVSLEATIEVLGQGSDQQSTLRVCLATPSVYSEVSGRPAPPPTTPDHSYGNWRLP